MEYRNRRPENWPWPKLAASALPPPGRPWVLPPGGGSWLRRAAHPLPRTGWFGWSTPGCPLGAQTTPQQRHLTPGLGGSLCEAGRPAESLALSLGNGFWGEGMPTQNLPVLPDPVWENQVCPHHQGPRGNTHPSVIRSPPRWEALLPPALPVGRGRGTWPTEAGGPLVPWRGARVGTPEPSPGPQRPSLPLQPPPPPRSMGAACRAVGTADLCVGHISAPPRLAGEAFPGHPDHRALLTCYPLPGQPLSFSQEAGAGSPVCPVLSSQGRTGWRRPLQ